MRVLVVGSGGREHALSWKIAQSPLLSALFCAPGNPGVEEIAARPDIRDTHIEGIVTFCEKERIDLVVVGPEAPLMLGLSNRLHERGIPVFGPCAEGARIEGSKAFCKQLLREKGVPTAEYRVFDEYVEAASYARVAPYPVVIKADGLAAGKGVFIVAEPGVALRVLEDLMLRGTLGEAGRRVVFEEYLEGPELSLLCLVSGTSVVPLAPSRDHKRVGDNDTGPNTGGMGAISPVPGVGQALIDEIIERIVSPTARALSDIGIDYRGVLYAGLVLTTEGPKVLEFNARFGDPETQSILPRLDEDLLPLLRDTANGTLVPRQVKWKDKACVCVVAASGGYPGTYTTGHRISLPRVTEDTVIFHAGTARDADGCLVTAGGRVLSVTALGDDIKGAADLAYDVMSGVRFHGMHYRTDIGRGEEV